MGRKIFVSYKHSDHDVAALSGAGNNTTVRTYVDYIADILIGNSDHIYKGEHANEDLSGYSENYIWEHLKDKLYDTSVTVVLISPNMKEPYVREEYQWIPWEIKYSISRQHRGETTSQRNAIVAVKLPDKNGRYDYYEDMKLFRILKCNIDSRYIPVFCWSSFVQRFDYCIDTAFMYKQRVEEKWIVKSI